MKFKSSLRGGAWAALLVALAVCSAQAGASAQSGRRKTTAKSPVPTPEAAESESKPRAPEKKTPAVLATFAVMEYDASVFMSGYVTTSDVLDHFVRRLGQSPSVAVTRAGKGGRKEAAERAKSSKDAHVVLFQLEEGMGVGGGGGRTDARELVIKTYVYAPGTGDLKYVDTTYQRPYRSTATVGGVRLPVPGRRVERYPSELQLEQAAAEAADRLLSRFHVTPPPDR